MSFEQYLVPYLVGLMACLGAVYFFARKRKMEKLREKNASELNHRKDDQTKNN